MKMKLNDDLARRRWRLEERDLAIKAHHDAVMAARYDPVLEQGDVWVNDDIRDLTVTVEADGVTVDGVWDPHAEHEVLQLEPTQESTLGMDDGALETVDEAEDDVEYEGPAANPFMRAPAGRRGSIWDTELEPGRSNPFIC